MQEKHSIRKGISEEDLQKAFKEQVVANIDQAVAEAWQELQKGGKKKVILATSCTYLHVPRICNSNKISGRRGEIRTLTVFPPGDFKSPVSTIPPPARFLDYNRALRIRKPQGHR